MSASGDQGVAATSEADLTALRERAAAIALAAQAAQATAGEARISLEEARAAGGEPPDSIAAREAALATAQETSQQEAIASGPGPAAAQADGVLHPALVDLRREMAERDAKLAADAAATAQRVDQLTQALAARATPGAGKRLAELQVGATDERNRLILRILAEAADRYIVYRAINASALSNDGQERRAQLAHSRVCVHLSDHPETRALQVDSLSQVSDLRIKVAGLINGRWRDPYFERAFADALGMAAALDVTNARARLTELLAELQHESGRIGQAWQMAFSCVAWAAFVSVLFLFSEHIHPFEQPGTNVWLAAKAGATGALFSIATMFNKRALAPDNKKIRIALEATMRVGSGVIAGGALLLALSSGFFTKPVGGDSGVQIANWMYVVVIGFLAGFVERLVPDLFDKVQLDPANKQVAGVGGAAGGIPAAGGPAGPPANRPAAAPDAAQGTAQGTAAGVRLNSATTVTQPRSGESPPEGNGSAPVASPARGSSSSG